MSTLLLSSVHTLSVNILRCVRLYIKQKYYYYYGGRSGLSLGFVDVMLAGIVMLTLIECRLYYFSDGWPSVKYQASCAHQQSSSSCSACKRVFCYLVSVMFVSKPQEGCRFESPSSRHVGTLGKSFTRICL